MDNKIKTTGKIFIGIVTSDKMQNTIAISMEYKSRHPLYRKIVKKHKTIYSENNLSAKNGDQVKVRETRPQSKIKRFTTLEILKTA